MQDAITILEGILLTPLTPNDLCEWTIAVHQSLLVVEPLVDRRLVRWRTDAASTQTSMAPESQALRDQLAAADALLLEQLGILRGRFERLLSCEARIPSELANRVDVAERLRRDALTLVHGLRLQEEAIQAWQ